MRKLLPIALLIAPIALLQACMRSDSDKSVKALQEIGLLSGVLMQKNVVPKDQADFEEHTRVAGAANDPWGAPYQMERVAMRTIKIYSKGPDGKPGTPDDITQEFTFPTGAGLEGMKVTRDDGVEAIKSPDGSKTFWTTQKDVGANQITDYWIGDATAKAEKPVRSQTVNTDDFRRGVTLVKWSKDGRYLVVKDLDSSSRPDADSRSTLVTLDTTNGKVVESEPANVEWMEY